MSCVVSSSEEVWGVIWNFIFILFTLDRHGLDGWMDASERHFNDDDEHGCAIEEDDTDTTIGTDDTTDDGLRRTTTK